MWSTPFSNLNDALAAADPYAAAGLPVQVWVKATTLPYLPDRVLPGATGTLTNRDFTFSVGTGVELYGGFAGTEVNLTDRNPALFRSTVLSGDLNGTPLDRTDDSFSVVYVSEPPFSSTLTVARTTVIDGFRITSGNANVQGSVAPTVEFERESGGGIYASGSPLRVENVTFIGNFARDAGGGMYFGGDTEVIPGGTNGFQLLNCHFYRNLANRGGGIGAARIGDFHNNVIIQNSFIYSCAFSGNEATHSGVGGKGGAIFMGSRDAPVDICNCIMDSNRSEGAGSAVFIGGNPVVSGVRIGSCTITRNAIIPQTGMGSSGSCVYYQATGIGEQLRNSIVWNNSDPATNLQIGPTAMLGNVSVDHCCIQGGAAGQGNKNQDPLFMGPTNYELSTGSPCIDAGSDEILLDDLPDLDGDTVTGEPVPADFRRLLPQFSRSVDLVPGNTTSPTTFAPGNTDMGALEKQQPGS